MVDYAGVTDLRLNVDWLVSVARQMETAGLRVAVFAPRPAIYGTHRQVFQLAGVREGETASVFGDRAAAVRWLIAG